MDSLQATKIKHLGTRITHAIKKGLADDGLIPSRGREFSLASTSTDAKAHPTCHPIGTAYDALV